MKTVAKASVWTRRDWAKKKGLMARNAHAKLAAQNAKMRWRRKKVATSPLHTTIPMNHLANAKSLKEAHTESSPKACLSPAIHIVVTPG
jgi:hypothetical protein